MIHLLANMNMLRQVGVQLEQAAGTARFATIYICGGVLSMVGSAVFSTNNVTVGASGALFGLLGAFLAELLINCHLLTFKEGLCAFASIGITIVSEEARSRARRGTRWRRQLAGVPLQHAIARLERACIILAARFAAFPSPPPRRTDNQPRGRPTALRGQLCAPVGPGGRPVHGLHAAHPR